ncbi:MAG: hypothetical protein LBP56_01035 [Odoribacteraceae bacterium]|jgi:GTPase involved in cell partitioning and DNA repair|nr:hypothetical protein [Odoribacteraceae bacterium]
MENGIKHLVTCAVIACVVACSPMSKEAYLEKYNAFISEISEHHESYDDETWEKQSEKYEKFSGEWYDQFKEELTLKDQITVKANQAKWYYYRNLNEATSTIKHLLDALDVKGIKKQIQYYIDNDMQSDLQKFYEDAKKAGKDAVKAVTEILNELNVKMENIEK